MSERTNNNFMISLYDKGLLDAKTVLSSFGIEDDKDDMNVEYNPDTALDIEL